MAAQFGQAPLASPLASALETGATSARPLIQAPHNVRLDGMIRRSLSGAWFPSPYSVGRRSPFTVVEDVADTALFFAASCGHLPEILVV